MESLDADQSYRELRREVTNKAFTVNLINTVTTVLAVGAIVGGYFAFGPIAAAIAGEGVLAASTAALTTAGLSIVAGVAAIGLGVSNFKRNHDLALDYEELDIKRRSSYLEKVVEKSEGKVNPLTLDAQLGQGHGNARGDWAERVSSGDLARSAADIATDVTLR